jgi:hypothetical protein
MTRHAESAARKNGRPVYLLRIQRIQPGDGERDLRWILKKLLRQFGFRCLAAHKETQQCPLFQ